jgi:uncharacterized protein YjcR
MKYTEDQKNEARKYYLQEFKAKEIAAKCQLPLRTVQDWIKKEAWHEIMPNKDLLLKAQQRLFHLMNVDKKSDSQLKEMSTLSDVIDKLAKTKIRLEEHAARQKDPERFIEHIGKSGTGKKRRRGKSKNDFREIDLDELREKFRSVLFDYQLDLWDNIHERTRNILKSRQVGLTWYFAREAFTDALLTGDNQIFLSASRNQADIFRGYIKDFAREWYEVELKGKDTIELQTPNGTATLYFLSTNSHTAQGYHGHVYVDEYFWMPGFKKLQTVASAMATHKKWRKTYFSTPSIKNHEAYPFWTGDQHNEKMRHKKQKLIDFPGMAELRKTGIRCADNQWRKVITIEDAEAGGCDLFDIEELRLEYSLDAFAQLFMCKFIDDNKSIFRFSILEKALCNSAKWTDFYPRAERPFGDKPVWIGYDPSRHVDGACIVVIAPPEEIMGRFRVLERHTLHNQAWQTQAALIESLTEKYNVQHIGMDKTGPGNGVYELVKAFFPRVQALHYSVEIKTELVLKAQDVLNSNRIEWDMEASDIAHAFMMIKQKATGNGGITYAADRSATTGHADVAWAIMHALIKEGLKRPTQKRKGRSTFAKAA